VFTAGDVTDGRVKNIARPEGNATGFAAAFSSLGGKWLELLKEAAPKASPPAKLSPMWTESCVVPRSAICRFNTQPVFVW
jgi:hypothetical protein